jgi:hypothetical protein
MEKAQLLAVAAAFFAAYPALDVVYITPDGQSFTEKNKSLGQDHAKARFGGKLERVTRTEVQESATSAESGGPARSEEDQKAIDARVEALKALGLTEPVAKKLRVSGLEDLSKLTDKQLAEYNGILEKEKQSQTS